DEFEDDEDEFEDDEEIEDEAELGDEKKNEDKLVVKRKRNLSQVMAECKELTKQKKQKNWNKEDEE
ncbi:hypothetical protein RFI_38669, partial [Reticulomyxa filosa]